MHSHKVKNDHSHTFNIKSYLITGVNDRKSEKEPYYIFYHLSPLTHLPQCFYVSSCAQTGKFQFSIFKHTNEQRSFSYCKTLSQIPSTIHLYIQTQDLRKPPVQKCHGIVHKPSFQKSTYHTDSFYFPDVVSSAVMFLPLSVILSSVALILL